MNPASQAIEAVEDALALCRKSFISVGVFSFFLNILMLTPMFYMINVFDKAVATNSIPTLISLIVIALFLYTVMGLLDWIRSVILVHVGGRIDVILAPRIYQLSFSSDSGFRNIGAQPLADLNGLRQFLASSNAAIIFDLPWVPLFMMLMYLFHPTLFVVAVFCIAIMAVVAIVNQRNTTKGLAEANEKANIIAAQTQRNIRNAEVAAAMGMMAPLTQRWREQQDDMLQLQATTSVATSGYSAAIKTLSMMMQSAAITTGAVLAMAQEISPGVIIGAALLLGKTLQPIQQAVTSWKSFVDARGQYLRLNSLLEENPPVLEKMALPAVRGRVSANQAVVVPPGSKQPTLMDISFNLPSGTTTMVLGASAAGKSTLIRAILGLWPTIQGDIRIDGSESKYFDRSELGPQIGYLPQDIELFDGSIADNIARFGAVDADLVIQAAQDAGVHQIILGLPQGYDTVISGIQGLLSPGQRQRIALARALYARPKLLILDEPNSNLDELGEQALHAAMVSMKAYGTTIIMVSHRQEVLSLADYLIILANGRITDQGPRDEVVARVLATQQAQQDQANIATIPSGAGGVS
ncbi:type I secretion system permease/ATPase [bacterium]|nr:type I secretion system permease/ATPase [bacterium]